MKIFLIVLVIILAIAIVSVVYPIISGRPAGEKQPSGTSLYKSGDGGATWQNVTSFPGGAVTVLRFDAENPEYLLTGTIGRGIWRGKRNGEEWKQYPLSLGEGAKIFDILEPASDKDLTALVFYSGRGRVIQQRGETREELLFTPAERYAFFQGSASRDKKLLRVIGSDGGLYESRDGGKTWEVLSRFQEGLSLFEPNPSRDLQMWVIDTKGDLFRSDNGGRDWADLRDGLNEFSGAKNARMLFFDPTSNTLYHASSFGLLRSPDLGKTWEIVKTTISPELLPVTAVAVEPGNPKKIFAGAGGQLYISENRGITWRGTRVASAEISRILIDPKNSKNIFLGLAETAR